MCVFSCSMPPVFLAEWPGSFRCYCGNMGGGMVTEVRVSTESWPWRRFSHSRLFNYESCSLPLRYPGLQICWKIMFLMQNKPHTIAQTPYVYDTKRKVQICTTEYILIKALSSLFLALSLSLWCWGVKIGCQNFPTLTAAGRLVSFHKRGYLG